ncbi:MAG TPA: helix-turn-helix domain-containing protein [Solirubrobacteraceae bacterium]|nr:helix-turn-helix domain-containing protein [Solirubrobacteraceae bacterium]
MPTGELPLLDTPRPERADAARNRRRVLDAAAALFAERGVDGVAMEKVARAAGVGKGTLFRRFGDRQGLLVALLDDAERRLQDALLRGPPPLGPGAPAEERLLAFLHGLVELLEERGDIVRASERSSPGARLRTAAYAGWHLHVAVLLGELRPDADAAALAHVLLAPLAADTWLGLRREGGLGRAALTALVAEQWSRAAVSGTPGSP